MTTIASYQVGPRPVALRMPNAAQASSEAEQRETERARPRDDLRQRLDDLIGGEVATGRLSESQAADLRAVFNDAFSVFGAQAPAGRSKTVASETTGEVSTEETPPTDRPTPLSEAAKNATPAAGTLQGFLDALQASLDAGGASTYGASGRNNVAAIKTVPPLLINYRT